MAKKDGPREAKHAANERKRRAAKPHHNGEGRRSGYRGRIQEKKSIEAGKSSKGCGPKLAMLILPFVAVGAYLLFS